MSSIIPTTETTNKYVPVLETLCQRLMADDTTSTALRIRKILNCCIDIMCHAFNGDHDILNLEIYGLWKNIPIPPLSWVLGFEKTHTEHDDRSLIAAWTIWYVGPDGTMYVDQGHGGQNINLEVDTDYPTCDLFRVRHCYYVISDKIIPPLTPQQLQSAMDLAEYQSSKGVTND